MLKCINLQFSLEIAKIDHFKQILDVFMITLKFQKVVRYLNGLLSPWTLSTDFAASLLAVVVANVKIFDCSLKLEYHNKTNKNLVASVNDFDLRLKCQITFLFVFITLFWHFLFYKVGFLNKII